MRASLLIGLAATLLLGACGGDGGNTPNPDGGGTVCASAADCDDGVFCNGAEVCAPGAAAAGADGCLAGAAECAGMTCNETTDMCEAGCPDADGDGTEDIACGGTDCDDADANRFPGNPEVCDVNGHDEDCDDTTFGVRDFDGDGFTDDRCCNGSNCGRDCDDTRSGAHPNVPEVCDRRDNDCNGVVDEGLLQAVNADLDRDLHGDPNMPVMACPGAAGTSASVLDCDDTNPLINTPQAEINDGIDNNCDGTTDMATTPVTWYADVDGDGWGDPDGATMSALSEPTGFALLPYDCDDGNADINPLAPELCNAIDDNCSGDSDFNMGVVNDWEDDDADGFPDTACGGNDCDDTDPLTFMGALELCDTRDNDCDGDVDEGCGGSECLAPLALPLSGADASLDITLSEGGSCAINQADRAGPRYDLLAGSLFIQGPGSATFSAPSVEVVSASAGTVAPQTVTGIPLDTDVTIELDLPEAEDDLRVRIVVRASGEPVPGAATLTLVSLDILDCVGIAVGGRCNIPVGGMLAVDGVCTRSMPSPASADACVETCEAAQVGQSCFVTGGTCTEINEPEGTFYGCAAGGDTGTGGEVCAGAAAGDNCSTPGDGLEGICLRDQPMVGAVDTCRATPGCSEPLVGMDCFAGAGTCTAYVETEGTFYACDGQGRF